jgi:hypothetical protein
MDSRVAYIFSPASAESKKAPGAVDLLNSAGNAILNAARALSLNETDLGTVDPLNSAGNAILNAARALSLNETDLGTVDPLNSAGNAILNAARALSLNETDLGTVDPLNSAGNAILNAARALSSQLHNAEERIIALEADVTRYRNRAECAEKWLLQISEELEQYLLGDNHNRPERKNVDELRERLGLRPATYSP